MGNKSFRSKHKTNLGFKELKQKEETKDPDNSQDSKAYHPLPDAPPTPTPDSRKEGVQMTQHHDTEHINEAKEVS